MPITAVGFGGGWGGGEGTRDEERRAFVALVIVCRRVVSFKK